MYSDTHISKNAHVNVPVGKPNGGENGIWKGGRGEKYKIEQEMSLDDRRPGTELSQPNAPGVQKNGEGRFHCQVQRNACTFPSLCILGLVCRGLWAPPPALQGSLGAVQLAVPLAPPWHRSRRRWARLSQGSSLILGTQLCSHANSNTYETCDLWANCLTLLTLSLPTCEKGLGTVIASEGGVRSPRANACEDLITGPRRSASWEILGYWHSSLLPPYKAAKLA